MFQNAAPINPSIESDPVKVLPASAVDKQTLEMQEKLIQKQKELLELQQKKLELEVLQTKVKLQEQLKSNVPLPNRPQVNKYIVDYVLMDIKKECTRLFNKFAEQHLFMISRIKPLMRF